MIKIFQLPALRFQDQAHFLKVEGMVKNWIKQKIQNNGSKPLSYVTSSRTDDGWYYLILKSKAIKDKTILKQLITKYNSENEQKIKYYEEPMYEDIKNGVSRQRKIKKQMLQKEGGYRSYQNSYNQNDAQFKIPTYSRQNMGMMYPGLYNNGYDYPNMGMSHQQMYMSQGQTEAKLEKVFIRRAVESSDEDTVKQQTSTNQTKILQTPKAENSPSKVINESIQKKLEPKNAKNKKQDNNKKQKQDKQEKQPKNKVVLDDSDFPTIG